MSDELEWIYLHDPKDRNEHFGEVKYAKLPNGDRKVEIVFMPSEDWAANELALNALAIDGSSSMVEEFGRHHQAAFLQERNNKVQMFAQPLGGFLGKNHQGKCGLAYWATGDDGSGLQPVGMYSREEFESLKMRGPDEFGGATKLAPIVSYLWDQVFANTDGEGVAVILTDGMWSDQQDVIELTQKMCDEISSGRRNLMKIVILIYITKSTENDLDRIESAMTELDDYESGTDVDVWDHKWVKHLQNFAQIYIEMAKDLPLAPGRIVDNNGTVLLESDDLKYGMSFVLPAGSTSAKLVIDGDTEFEQTIPD